MGLVSLVEKTSMFELSSVVGLIVTDWISTPVSLLFVEPDAPLSRRNRTVTITTKA